jgi:RNA polymerase sigma factor (sigma-70 family)
MAVTETGHLASREIDDLYRAHVAEVYRYAFAVLGNHADAEDVTQTTFLNAYRALEQGVKPRKPSNWLLTIASNAIKQRFRQEQSRPREVELHDRIPHAEPQDDDAPSVGELLTALSKIPPQQRQAIVLREFEGRSYVEIAEILGVTTSALETLLFRARRSLADELEHQLTCTDAQLAVSKSVDGRLGRKEKRRLRDHLAECPDCASFARSQQRHRSALRGLALVPIPLSLTLFKGFEGTASAAVVPITAGAGAGAAAVGAGVGVSAGGMAAGTSGGVLAGGVGLKVAAVVAAAGVAGGVGVAGSSEVDKKPAKADRSSSQRPGVRLGQVAPRGVSVPGNGVARGKLSAPGQTKGAAAAKAKARAKVAASARRARAQAQTKANARGQGVSAEKRAASAGRKATRTPNRATPNANGQQTRARGAPEPRAAAQPKQTEEKAPPPTSQTAPEATPTGATEPTGATQPTQPTPNGGGPNGTSADKAGGPKEK